MFVCLPWFLTITFLLGGEGGKADWKGSLTFTQVKELIPFKVTWHLEPHSSSVLTTHWPSPLTNFWLVHLTPTSFHSLCTLICVSIKLLSPKCPKFLVSTVKGRVCSILSVFVSGVKNGWCNWFLKLVHFWEPMTAHFFTHHHKFLWHCNFLTSFFLNENVSS